VRLVTRRETRNGRPFDAASGDGFARIWPEGGASVVAGALLMPAAGGGKGMPGPA